MKTAASTWHPRGKPSWPDWKTATPETRVEHVRTGRRGTFVKAIVDRTAGSRYAVVDWDNGYRGRVVAPAYDLRPIPTKENHEDR